MFDVTRPAEGPASARRRGAGRRRNRKLLASGLVGALMGGVLVVIPAQANSQPAPTRLAAQPEKLDADGAPVRTSAWPYAPQRQTAAPEPVWPAPATARVSLPAATDRRAGGGPARAGDLPVFVDRVAGPAGERVDALTVRILDRATAPAGWRDGLLMRIDSPSALVADGAARMSVDYSAFRHAYGGDWASRLRLWQLPECATTTPAATGCAATALPSTNDATSATVTAQVPVGSGGSLVALAAGPSGSSGDFTATSLAPSATWAAGGNSGAFTWTYPMQAPPAIAGATPDLTLAYSSSSVDGRSEVTNNQPSWVGEGFDYWPGSIERRYVPCAEDMAGAANNTRETGDLCWRSDNAVLTLNGQGTELVFEAGKGWHARQENGSKIEKLTGASGNGDDNGEYWKVTTADGTQYFFGRHTLPGQSSVTDSTWTVPVAGNHPAADGKPNDPCHASTFVGSFCAQAWRWNLDYVVDVRGNTMSYWYGKESNKYARNLTESDAASYIRGGTLNRIDYGTWDRGSTDRSVTPVAQVIFESANRCVTSSCATHNATNWPDTPWDQECTGSTCAKNYSPTFWSTKRLSTITTRVWDTTKTTAAWQNVASWTLTHSFPSSGDGSNHAGMWLEKIVSAGLVGTAVTMPPITFTPVSMPNRVLTMNTATSNWQRIDYIVTETGAKIDVEYDLPECSGSNLPAAAHTNTMRCYPVMVTDPDDPTGKKLIPEWWHKHRVKSVSTSDLPTDQSGHQAPPTFTYYKYVGAPAWHYADDDGLTKPKRKTWNQFRGYDTVEVRVGDVPGAQSLTRTRYLRGMHGDRISPTGGTRSVTVPASAGTETVYDEDQFAGMVREQTVYNGVDTKPVSRTVHVPWMSPPTASRTVNDDTVTARFTNTKATYSGTALGPDGARGWRTTRTQSWFSDAYGATDRTQDDGDLAKTGDEKCTTYLYNRNTDKNLLTPLKQTTTTTLPCGTAPTTPDHVISDSRTYYDGASSVSTAPTYGSVTKTEQLKDWSQAGGTAWQTTSESTFDGYGRVRTATDLRGNTTLTDYTPASGGPVTRLTTTSPSPYKWVTKTDVNPYWGSTTKTEDPNGGITDVSYDGLGRVWRVWNVGWVKQGHESKPSAEYVYTLAPNRDAYPYIVSRTLHAAGGYRTAYEITDSLLRPRQTQTAAVGADRIVTDTLYDKLGRAATTYSAHAEPGGPSGKVWWEPEWSVPAVNRTLFDNADRPIAQVFLSGDGVDNLVEQWRTTTGYEGDLTKVTPPEGGTPTTTVTDVEGRTVELRQHTTDQGVAGAYQSTRYGYGAKDELRSVTDHLDNAWTYTFDIKGRRVKVSDPDKGDSTTEYNDYNDVVKTTDARGKSLWAVYDTLGRKTELRDDSSTGRLRTKWKYDTLYTTSTAGAKAQLTESYRYEYDQSGTASIYKWQVGGFTSRSQPSSVNYVIPPVEGANLAATWSYGYGYSEYDGSATSILYPDGGGLTGETVTTVYDATTGLPAKLGTTMIGVSAYVAAQDYTRFGEPSKTLLETASGQYVEDETYYDEATRRVSRNTVKPESTARTVSDRNYEYDDAGNITSIVDQPQVGSRDAQCFRQDKLRRLTSAWTPKTGVDCKPAASLANLGGPAPYWLDWTFDTMGNRTQEVSHAAAGETKRTYTVPTGGRDVVRPHAVTRVTTEAPGAAAVVTNYTYDNAGNTSCRPAGSAANTCPPGGSSQTLTWDAEGRLAGIAAGASSLEANVYSADGVRLVRRDAGGVTLFLPGQEVRRDSNGSVTGTRSYSFNGKVVATRKASGLSWIHSDHQGTQHTSVDAASQAVTARRQTPYGQPRGADPAWPNAKGFVGGDKDSTGMIHVGARKYDPALGRFISVDPIQDLADPQQWHGYSYANNNPVTQSDPTGLAPCEPGEDCSGYIPGNEKANKKAKKTNPCWPTRCGSSSGKGTGGGGSGGSGGKGGDGWRGVPWAAPKSEWKGLPLGPFPSGPWLVFVPTQRPCHNYNSAYSSPAACEDAAAAAEVEAREARAAADEEYEAALKKYHSNSFNRGEGYCLFPWGCRDEMPVYPDPTEALARKRAGQQEAEKESNWSANMSVGLFCLGVCFGFQLERDGLKGVAGCCGLGVSGPGAGVGGQYADGNPRPWSVQGCAGLAANGCVQVGATDKGNPAVSGSLNTGSMLFFGPVYTFKLPPPS